MGRATTDQSSTNTASATLGTIFLSPSDAEGKLMQERWRMWQKTQAAERAQQLEILHKAISGTHNEEGLRVLHETTALPHILKLERWRLQTISHLESLIYSVLDAHESLESPLWRGELSPLSMRLATEEEARNYCPDSTGVQTTPQPQTPKNRDVVLDNGQRLVAEDTESQAMLNFIGHYIDSNDDAPSAMIDFHRDLRLRENYAERTEHALEASFSMYGIAKDFAMTLRHAEQTDDAKKRKLFHDQADELLMEFNLQRYGLLALLKTSHWNDPAKHAQEDKEFVQQLSSDLLMHALAEQSYALPTANELREKDFQSESYATVESYFASAYDHLQRVLGMRPHRDRVTQVPAVDAAEIDRPQGRLH